MFTNNQEIQAPIEHSMQYDTVSAGKLLSSQCPLFLLSSLLALVPFGPTQTPKPCRY